MILVALFNCAFDFLHKHSGLIVLLLWALGVRFEGALLAYLFIEAVGSAPRE